MTKSIEESFRIATLGIFAVTVAIAAYHRWQAAQSGERISRRDEGMLLAVTLRVAGGVLWLATAAYLIHPQWVAWAAVPLPDAVRWCGAVVGAASSVMMYWTLTNLGKNLTDTVVTRQAATLVTSGPYRWVRHPFYVTTTLLVLAVTLLTANWLIGLSGLVVLTLLVVRTKTEEEKLVERFGEEYREYMARTGRFWPKF